jgi:hypothetical protein
MDRWIKNTAASRRMRMTGQAVVRRSQRSVRKSGLAIAQVRTAIVSSARALMRSTRKRSG